MAWVGKQGTGKYTFPYKQVQFQSYSIDVTELIIFSE